MHQFQHYKSKIRNLDEKFLPSAGQNLDAGVQSSNSINKNNLRPANYSQLSRHPYKSLFSLLKVAMRLVFRPFFDGF